MPKIELNNNFEYLKRCLNEYNLGDFITISEIKEKLNEEYEMSEIPILRAFRYLEKVGVVFLLPKEMWLKTQHYGNKSKTYVLVRRYD